MMGEVDEKGLPSTTADDDRRLAEHLAVGADGRHVLAVERGVVALPAHRERAFLAAAGRQLQDEGGNPWPFGSCCSVTKAAPPLQ